MAFKTEWLKELETEFTDKEKQLAKAGKDKPGNTEYNHVTDVLIWLNQALMSNEGSKDFNIAVSELNRLRVFEKYKGYRA